VAGSDGASSASSKVSLLQDLGGELQGSLATLRGQGEVVADISAKGPEAVSTTDVG
jgi:hypothetical protein